MKSILCFAIVAFAGALSAFSQIVDLNNPPEGTVRFISGDNTIDTGVLVRNIGDFNGDGIADFAIAAPLSDRVYVIYGRRNFAPTINLSSFGPYGFIIKGNEQTAFGSSLDSPGDVNRDGKDDLVIGAPFDGTGGRIYVISGSVNLQDMSVADESRILLIVEGAPGENLGQYLGHGGLIDSDSSADLLIPSPSYIGAGDDDAVISGAAYIIYGQITFAQKIIQTQSLDPEQTLTILNEPAGGNTGYNFGCCFDRVGDFSGTGASDLALYVGSRVEPAQALIRMIHTNQTLKGVQSISQFAGNSLSITLRLFDTSAMYQLSSLTACDLTQDGRPELICGFPAASVVKDGTSNGVTAIITNSGGQNGELPIDRDNLQSAILISAAGEKSGFGIAVDCVKDYLFVGAPYASVASGGINNQGGMYTISTKALTFPGILNDVADQVNPLFLGREAGDLFGGSVARLGDLNRDGYEDVLVSTSEIGQNAAVAYIVQAKPSQNTGVWDFTLY